MVKDGRPATLATWVAWCLWSAFLGLSVALLLNSALYGRVPIGELVASRFGGFGLRATGVLVAAWWLAYGWMLWRRSNRIDWADAALPGIPLAVGAVLPLAAIYGSDLANHYFYYNTVDRNQPKPLALLLIIVSATILLQMVQLKIAGGLSSRDALASTMDEALDPIILLFLVAIGTIQGSAYVGHLHTDFPRYWAISDAMTTGQPYPMTPTEASLRRGGLSDYLIDLPFQPAVLALSYALFGHNALAAYIPGLVANLTLPIFIYILYRQLIGSRMVATSLAAFVLLFPPMRFYSLNTVGTDALFFVVIAAICCVAVHFARTGWPRQIWPSIALGLLAAAVVLTRPEGTAYAGIPLLLALTLSMKMRQRITAVVSFAVPVALFSATLVSTYGILWPGNWSGTMGIQNVAENWKILERTTIPNLASAMQMDPAHLTGLFALLIVLALVGSLPWFYRPRRLFLLMIPAWANLAAVMAYEPVVSMAALREEFFRHISYTVLFLVLAAGIVVVTAVRAIPSRIPRRAAFLLLNCLMAIAVLWSIHYLEKPSLNFGDGAGNLLGSRRLLMSDIVAHPYPLPQLGFDLVDGRHVATRPSDLLSDFQDRIDAFFGRYDAVRSTAGTPYAIASRYLYLAALLSALLPSIHRLIGSSTRSKHAGKSIALLREEQNAPPTHQPATID